MTIQGFGPRRRGGREGGEGGAKGRRRCTSETLAWCLTCGAGTSVVVHACAGCLLRYFRFSRFLATFFSFPPRQGERLTHREPPSSVPGPDASLCQALTTKRTLGQKRPMATMFTAESLRRIHQHTSCAHRIYHPGVVRLVLSSEGPHGSSLFSFVRTTKISACVP